LNSIKLAQETSISDAADILEHKQQEIMKKEDRIIDLESRLKHVTEELELKGTKINNLETEIDNASKTLKDSAKYKDQISTLESTLKEQDVAVTKLSDELEKAHTTLEEVHLKLAQTDKENDGLRLKAEGVTKFMVLFGEPWLVKNSKYRLRGDLPMDNVESTLTCIAGKSLVLIGGYAKEAEDKKDFVYSSGQNDMKTASVYVTWRTTSGRTSSQTSRGSETRAPRRAGRGRDTRLASSAQPKWSSSAARPRQWTRRRDRPSKS